MSKLFLLILLLSGCGIHATVVEVSAGTTGFIEEARKGKKNYTSGNQSERRTEYNNLLESRIVYEEEKREDMQ